MIRWILFPIVLTAIACPVSAAPKITAEKTVYHAVVFSSGKNGGFEDNTIPTLTYLRQKLKPKKLGWTVVTEGEDPAEVFEKLKPDFVLSEPGAFFELRTRYSVVHLATRKSVHAADAAESAGSAFIVRASNSRYTDLLSLRGSTAVSTDPKSFTWLTALHALYAEGFPPDHFFGKVLTYATLYPGAFAMLDSGEADVAVLPACALEYLDRTGKINIGDYRVISRKTSDSLVCAHSSELYPDFIFSAAESVPSEVVWRVTSALLSMPPENGGEWTVGQRFSKVIDLYKDLKTGPYSYLRRRTWEYIWENYRHLFFWAVLIAGFLIINEFRLERKVDKRTEELNSALEKQIGLERALEANRQTLFRYERFGIVTQLSGMLTHEIQQPLVAITNFLAGLRLYLERNGKKDAVTEKTLEHLELNTDRIRGIVSKVRSYYKKETDIMTRVDLVEVCRSALRAFKAANVNDVPVLVSLPVTAPVRGERLELDVLVLNLLKNGAEACSGVKSPKLKLSVTPDDEGKHFYIMVNDNGPALDDQTFEHLKIIGDSLKTDGLGIGLSLCRGIVDKHGGTFFFERLDPQGIAAIVKLDSWKEL